MFEQHLVAQYRYDVGLAAGFDLSDLGHDNAVAPCVQVVAAWVFAAGTTGHSLE